MDEIKQAKRLVSVRFEPSMRAKLDDVALTSDRTIAQLIRYALIAYFEVERSCLAKQANSDKESNASRHTTLRLPEDLASLVDAFSTKNNVTVSDVIRDAVNVWLMQNNLELLGTPATSEGGEK